jgi:hypothetical protein
LSNGDRKEGIRKTNGRVEQNKVKYTHRRDPLRNPLKTDFGINNEKQDIK